MLFGFFVKGVWVATITKELMVLAGNYPAAVLLHHLVCNLTPPYPQKIVRKGSWTWWPMSHRDWAKSCNLTRKQVRRAEQKLEQSGLLETNVWLYKGAPTKHYRVDLSLFHSRLAQKGQSINIDIETSSFSEEIDEYSGHTSGAKAPLGEGGSKAMGKKDSAEVLRELENKKKLKPTVSRKITASYLANLWQQQLPLHVDKQFHKALTMKELGMLSQYLKAVGPHAVPALEWAIGNWPRMRYKAGEELGVTLPTSPVVWALLKACSVAVEGYQEGKEVAPQVKSFVVQTYATTGEQATASEIAQALKDMLGE